MSWERARSEKQKAERILAIQEAAGTLFMRTEYHGIGMGQIAQRAGFTRPNLYRYYTTKEEIFLSILERDLESWVETLESECDQMTTAPKARRRSIEEFTGWWVTRFVAQPRLPRLLPLMSFSLDDNAGEELLRSFKLHLAEISERIAGIVKRRLRWYPDDQLADFPMLQLALVTGVMPMANRGDVHNKVLADPRLSRFAVDFEEYYQKTLEQFLYGLSCLSGTREDGSYEQA